MPWPSALPPARGGVSAPLLGVAAESLSVSHAVALRAPSRGRRGSAPLVRRCVE